MPFLNDQYIILDNEVEWPKNYLTAKRESVNIIIICLHIIIFLYKKIKLPTVKFLVLKRMFKMAVLIDLLLNNLSECPLSRILN